jgi:hypothetical protein
MNKYISLIIHGRYYYWNGGLEKFDYKWARNLYRECRTIDVFSRWDVFYAKLSAKSFSKNAEKALLFRERLRLLLNYLVRVRNMELLIEH